MLKRPSAIPAAIVSVLLLLQGCGVPVSPPSSAKPTRSAPAPAPNTADFKTIVARVEPVAEGICRSKPGNRNCDFRILLDKNPNAPANAYQTLSESGRPVLVVNQTLIDQLQNADEIAFVISHEAAHHISDHISKQQANTYATGHWPPGWRRRRSAPIPRPSRRRRNWAPIPDRGSIRRTSSWKPTVLGRRSPIFRVMIQ